MKKIFALLLAVMMCLSLFACGGKEAVEENTVTEPTYEYFDEYHIPMPVGLDMGNQVSEDGIHHYYFIIPPVMADAAEQVMNEYLALLQDHRVDIESAGAIGSYILFMDGEPAGFTGLVFGEDSMIAVSLYDGGVPPVEEEPVEMPEEEPEPVVPEPVEITMDNWAEYFEFTYDYRYNYNGFDELEDVTMTFYFSLKPEYAAILDGDKSEATVEIFFVTGTQFGTYSEDYLEFTPDGYFEEWFDYESAREQDVYELSYNSSSGTLRTGYQVAYSDFEESSMGPWYPTQQEVIRIAGTLVFK